MRVSLVFVPQTLPHGAIHIEIEHILMVFGLVPRVYSVALA